jgi:hypothetical protein
MGGRVSEAPAIFATLPDYDAMVAAIIQRSAELGVTYGQLDEIAGLSTGYASKALGPSQTRKFGWLTTFLLMPELGLRVALIVDDEALAKRRLAAHEGQPNQARPNNTASPVSKRVLSRVQRHLSKNGNGKRWRGKSKKERAEHARRMAMMRWHPTYSWNDVKAAAQS